MFGRKNKVAETESQQSAGSVRVESTETHLSDPKYTPPKGRPTPSRKEREAARRTPLVPADRKAAKDAEKAANREYRMKQQQAMQTGDERYLPINDRGPQRRYIRDFVDARFNVGDVLLPVILLTFIIGLFTQTFQEYSILMMWVFILIWILDFWILWRKLKPKLIEKFGAVEPRSGFYTFNRSMMVRRFRLPKPQVARGQYPN